MSIGDVAIEYENEAFELKKENKQLKEEIKSLENKVHMHICISDNLREALSLCNRHLSAIFEGRKSPADVAKLIRVIDGVLHD